MRNPPRSPGPGFITSSPMNKKTPKSNAAATRNTKKLKRTYERSLENDIFPLLRRQFVPQPDFALLVTHYIISISSTDPNMQILPVMVINFA